MWPSIVFQPVELAKSLVGARVWERATPLSANERVAYSADTPSPRRTPEDHEA